ncbi:MAG: MarR family transcriptional regulator [Lentisphaeria bacterium]|nr:MarR family transcriptional regulator [Lentisphaeria bacterium]
MAKKRAAAVFESLFETSGLMQYLHMKTDPLMDSNISISQLKILGCLFRHQGEGMRLKDIAFEMDITPGGMSQAVDVLVRHGFVERISSEIDRRAVSIRLSEAGKAKRKKIYDFFVSMTDELMEGIAVEELEAFCRVTAQFRAKLNEKKQTLLTQLRDKNIKSKK